MAAIERSMNERYSWYRGRSDVVIIPRIRVTFAASILIHAAALWFLVPHLPLLSPGDARDPASERLQVVLAAPPPAPEPQPAPQAPPPRETRAVITARPRPRNASPEFAVPPPETPKIPPPPPPPAAEPPKPVPPVAGDLASYIEARRRARGDPGTSPEESESERRNRIVASNLPVSQSPLTGQDRKRGGGLFQITRMTYDDAEFHFFGFSKDAGRRAPQVIEVRLGANSDMRIAIVRRMIQLIRETERGDISWDSYRLGRVVELSARPEDNAGLEEFMMHEFFDQYPGSRR